MVPSEQKHTFDEILESEEYAKVARDIAARLEPLTWRDRETLCKRWVEECYDAMALALGNKGAEFAFALAIGRALHVLGAEFPEDEHMARLMLVSCFKKHREAAREFLDGAPSGVMVH